MISSGYCAVLYKVGNFHYAQIDCKHIFAKRKISYYFHRRHFLIKAYTYLKKFFF